MVNLKQSQRGTAPRWATFALCAMAIVAPGCGGGDPDVPDKQVQSANERAQTLSADPRAELAAGPPVYKVIMGHDGHPDPDDNLASLAGFMAIKRNYEAQPDRIKIIGMVYGDTTAARKRGMQTGQGSDDDRQAHANYLFYQRYSVPALTSVGLSKFKDGVPQTYNFNTTQLSQLTTGGQLIANTVKWSLLNTTTNYRVVYSAGGGENSAAEAISWLRKQGYSDAAIKEKFAIVEHSAWNWNNTNEGATKSIAADFTIRIEDQNKYTGLGKPPLTVSAGRTSDTFAHAWDVAIGSAASGIPNFRGKRDASDAGSHHFSSDPAALDTNWNTRNNDLAKPADKPGDIGRTIFYDKYQPAQMNADMN